MKMPEQTKDLRKLCILNANESDSDDKIRSLCEQFGTLLHFNRPATNKKLAFPLYKSESDAETAKNGLIREGYRVDYAKAKRSENDGDTASRHDGNVFRTPQRDDASENGANCYTEADSSDLDSSNKPYGICIKCGDKAYHNCGRCGDFYCSVECQTSDWLAHKRACFPMPKLVPAKSTYSLRASNANLAASKESVKSGISIKKQSVAQNIDAPDGSQHKMMVSSPPPKPVQNVTVQKPISPVPSIIERVETMKVQTPEPVIEKTIKAESVCEEARSGQSGSAISARERMKLAQLMADVRTPSSSESSGVAQITIPNDSEVIIAHVKSNTEVYVRSNQTAKEYAALITKVEFESRTAPKLTAYPNRQDVVMAPYEGGYYRAMVIKNDKDMGLVKVGFMDFGNSSDVAFDTLKELSKELKNTPRLVILVTLKNITSDANESEKSEMYNYLEELMANEKALKIKGDKPKLGSRDQIVLFDVISNESINDFLNAMAQKRYTLNDLGQKEVKDPNTLLIIGDEKIEKKYHHLRRQSRIEQLHGG